MALVVIDIVCVVVSGVGGGGGGGGVGVGGSCTGVVQLRVCCHGRVGEVCVNGGRGGRIRGRVGWGVTRRRGVTRRMGVRNTTSASGTTGGVGPRRTGTATAVRQGGGCGGCGGE